MNFEAFLLIFNLLVLAFSLFTLVRIIKQSREIDKIAESMISQATAMLNRYR